MYKKDAFLLNECFVLFAFVCSLNGYEGLGILMGLAAIFYADFSISFHVLKNDVPIIITISLFELIMIEVSGLSHVFASLYFLSLSSLLVSFIWSHASRKAKCYGMQWMLVTGILFFLSSFVSSFHQYTFLQTLLIIVVVFLPSSFHYCLTYSRHKQMISHRNTHRSVVE